MSFKDINSQVKLEEVVMKRPEYQYGYSDSQLKTNKNTTTAFLDSSTAYNDEIIPGSANGSLNNWTIDGAKKIKKFIRKEDLTNGMLQFPVGGTFMIQTASNIYTSSGSYTVPGVVINVDLFDESQVYKAGIGTVTGSTYQGITHYTLGIVDVEKGDRMQYYIYNNTASSFSLSVSMTMIKLS